MKKNPYENRLKKWLLRSLAAAVLVLVLGAIGLFSYTMVIRSMWKGDRTALAQVINDAYHGKYCTMSMGDVETVATPKAVDFFYYNFLTSPDTVVLAPFAAPDAEDAIRLTLPQATIALSPAGDGMNTGVRWVQDGREKAYTLRGVLPFSHLKQYFENNVYWNSLSALEREAAQTP